MAQVPDQNEVEKMQQASEQAEAEKRESQKQQGKEFVNNGQGVMPEDVWQNLPGKTEAQ